MKPYFQAKDHSSLWVTGRSMVYSSLILQYKHFPPLRINDRPIQRRKYTVVSSASLKCSSGQTDASGRSGLLWSGSNVSWAAGWRGPTSLLVFIATQGRPHTHVVNRGQLPGENGNFKLLHQTSKLQTPVLQRLSPPGSPWGSSTGAGWLLEKGRRPASVSPSRRDLPVCTALGDSRGQPSPGPSPRGKRFL